MLLCIGTVELAVTHLLLAHWWPGIALATSLLTAAGLVWLAGGVLSMRRLPVLVTDREVLMRAGRLRRATVPRDRIREILIDAGGAGLGPQDRSLLNMALLAGPNVLLRVEPPLRVGRREVAAVGHRLDDPAGFAAALAERTS